MPFKFDLFAEMILTYSWGILVAAMVITTMVVFGYFNLSTYRTDMCTAQAPFSCLNIQASNASAIEIVIKSIENQTIVIEQIELLEQSPPCIGIKNITANNNFLPHIIEPRDIVRIRIECTAAWHASDPVDSSIRIDYLNESEQQANATIRLHTTVKA